MKKVHHLLLVKFNDKMIMVIIVNSNVFINPAFQYAITEFIACKSSRHSVKYYDFYIMTIRALVFLYGEADIINSYKTMNEKGMGGFDVNVNKYGYPLSEINQFKIDFLNYYNIDMAEKRTIVKEKNKFLIEVEKDLIDMFFLKMQARALSTADINNFYAMLFTMDSANAYIKSFNLLTATDEYAVQNYFKIKLFQYENKIDFKAIIVNKLDMAIYNHFGIASDIVDKWTQSQVDYVNAQIFDYVKTSYDDPDLLNKMNQLLITRRKPKIEIIY